MRLLVFIALLGVATAQFGLGIYDFGTGSIPDFSFEYHRSANVILVRNATACFIVESDGSKDMSEWMRNRAGREHLEKELHDQIQAELGETVISLADLRIDYQDIRALAECFHHDVFRLRYPVS